MSVEGDLGGPSDHFAVTRYRAVDVSPSNVTSSRTLREFSPILLGLSVDDPFGQVYMNTPEWLATFNAQDPDAPFSTWVWANWITYGYIAYQIWWPAQGFGKWINNLQFNYDEIAPSRRYADTLRDIVAYVTDFIRISDNTIENLMMLNSFITSPDEHLNTPAHPDLLCWDWGVAPDPPASSSSTSSTPGAHPLRYLRMNQRNDGAGIARHPRIYGTGSNNPTSAQSGRPRRLGNTNYL